MCIPRHSSEYPIDLRKHKEGMEDIGYNALGVETEPCVGHDEWI